MNQQQVKALSFDRDAELLRDYIQQGSQTAFAEIFRRHLGMVYATCLRELHNSELASDASQAVFLILAKKAGTLHSGMRLTAWLFQTARFVASNLRRSEQRHARREQAAAAERGRMQMNQSRDLYEDLWRRTEPVLNEALAALKDCDRAAILLRYFEGYSLQETGAALSLSEDAARMRISRALEKMRRHLLKSGVVLSVAALTALLTERAASSAPIPTSLLQLIDLPPGATSPSTLGRPRAHAIARGAIETMILLKLKLATMIGAAGLIALGVVGLVRNAALTHPILRTTPGVVPNLHLPDTFTLHFSETKRNIRTQQMQARIRKLLRRSYDASVKNGSLTQEQADKQFEMAAAPPAPLERFDVTVSGHDGKLFYKNVNLDYPDVPEIAVYDGVHGLVWINENHVYIMQGLDFFHMCAFPLPGLGLAQVPLLKADGRTKPFAAANGAESRLEGEIPLTAFYTSHGVLYEPGALHVRVVDSKPQALDMQWKKGWGQDHWTFTNHRLFAGVWLAGHIRRIDYGFGAPSVQEDTELLNAGANPVSESQFALETWIKPGCIISYSGSEGSADIHYDAGQGSWEEQVKRHFNK